MTFWWDPAAGTRPWAQLGGLGAPVTVFLAQQNARKTLETGVTTVRDLGSWEYADIAMRNLINRGAMVGPRMFVAGYGLHATNQPPRPGVTTFDPGLADGVAEVQRAARGQIAAGADWIKVYGSTGSDQDVTGFQTFTYEEMKAVVDVARQAGKRTAIHSYGPDGARAAVRAGAESIEHATDMDDTTIADMVRRGTVYVPTVEHNQYYIDHKDEYGYDQAVTDRLTEYIHRNAETLRKAVKAGVKIAMGSDAVFTGFGENTRELARFVDAGMTPAQAIAAATTNGAALLGMDKTLGAVAPGYFADIVAVEGNPLSDIHALINGVRWVMKDGKVVVDKRLSGSSPSASARTGRANRPAELPALPLDADHHVEVLVPAQDRKPVLQGEGRDPGVVRRDRTTEAPEGHPQPGVGDSGPVRHGEDLEMRKVGLQPRFVGCAMAGLRDAVPEFAQHDDRNGRTNLPAQGVADTSIPIHERRQRVRVQNHVRSSGSMTSKTSSTLAWMRFVSLRSLRSLPKPCIQSGSVGTTLPVLAASFSCNASVTSSLSVWPRSAALDLALRNSGSGITSVVFTRPYCHIYGSTSTLEDLLPPVVPPDGVGGGGRRRQVAWISRPSSCTGTRTTLRIGGGFSSSGGLRPRPARMRLTVISRRGTAVMNTLLEGWTPWQGEITRRPRGGRTNRMSALIRQLSSSIHTGPPRFARRPSVPGGDCGTPYLDFTSVHSRSYSTLASPTSSMSSRRASTSEGGKMAGFARSAAGRSRAPAAFGAE